VLVLFVKVTLDPGASPYGLYRKERRKGLLKIKRCTAGRKRLPIAAGEMATSVQINGTGPLSCPQETPTHKERTKPMVPSSQRLTTNPYYM